MEIKNIITIIIVIILGIIVIKFIAKAIFKIIGVLLIIAIIGYFLFFFNGGLLDIGNKDFILYELHDKYCNQEDQNIKCTCIIDPLINDIQANYSKEDIVELQKDKFESFKVVFQSLRNNRVEIKNCLKEKDALHIWDDFLEDLKNLGIGKKLKESFESLKKEYKDVENSEDEDNQ